MPEELLAVERLEAGYPGKQILFGVDFVVRRREVVTLLGANGSGKSTVLNSVSGFVRAWRGSIKLGGEDIAGRPPHAIFRKGVVQVSQERDLFPDMTVEDNLRLGASVLREAPVGRLIEECFDHFPRLAERKTQRVQLMSGGEQQMVAIARALMGQPRILLLDEPSGGLAPKFVNEIGAIILRLKAAGTTMLMVEQNIKLALAVADRFLILRDGLVTERGDVRTAGRSQEDIVRSIYL
ncbi:MAG: ABC transporter ATP-binding protein [Hyphomicrobiales bacterium]